MGCEPTNGLPARNPMTSSPKLVWGSMFPQAFLLLEGQEGNKHGVRAWANSDPYHSH